MSLNGRQLLDEYLIFIFLYSVFSTILNTFPTILLHAVRMVLAAAVDGRAEGWKATVADFSTTCLNARTRDGETPCGEPPPEWLPAQTSPSPCGVGRIRRASYGLRSSPRQWPYHLAQHLREETRCVQDRRDVDASSYKPLNNAEDQFKHRKQQHMHITT